MSDPVLRLRAAALDWRVIDDEVVMLDGEQSQYLATNSAGTLLWQALREGATRAQLVAALVATYTIDPAQASADADAFLDDLRARDLLEER